MDLQHETSRWKGMQISSGKGQVTGSPSRIIRSVCYNKPSPETSLALPLSLSSINLSSPTLPPFTLVPVLHSSLYLHTWPVSQKHKTLYFHCPFPSGLQSPAVNHICCLQTHTRCHIRTRVETTTAVDKENKTSILI